MSPTVAILLLLAVGALGLLALRAISTTTRRNFTTGQEAVARTLLHLSWEHGPNAHLSGDVLDAVTRQARMTETTLLDGMKPPPPKAYAAGVRHSLAILDTCLAEAANPSTSTVTLIDLHKRLTKVDNVLLVTA